MLYFVIIMLGYVLIEYIFFLEWDLGKGLFWEMGVRNNRVFL